MVSSKAAGEKRPEAYPPGYVEDLFKPRTKLGAIFSSRYTFFKRCPILFFFVRK